MSEHGEGSGVSIKRLLEAGVHLGHSRRYWNPKTRDFVFTMRNQLHIIDLRKTIKHLDAACDAVRGMVSYDQEILFVGTKRNIAEIVESNARRAGMPFVNRRWLGGMLTNHRTIKLRVERLKAIEYEFEHRGTAHLSKKERLKLEAEHQRLENNVGGVKNMNGLPRALFVVDVANERIAVAEANKIRIPVFAVVDTNSDPSRIDYPIPGNDDSQRSVKLLVEALADACIAGAAEKPAGVVQAS
ncbi:MAG: 30S ribosomal protein S2 [Gammaproteobacteria bacterium AqS3]|nr:30S ribosomal protein S2 [Gammaproteobacteria bacterium AqS3]